jgi:hypothetical protein
MFDPAISTITKMADVRTSNVDSKLAPVNMGAKNVVC